MYTVYTYTCMVLAHPTYESLSWVVSVQHTDSPSPLKLLLFSMSVHSLISLALSLHCQDLLTIASAYECLSWVVSVQHTDSPSPFKLLLCSMSVHGLISLALSPHCQDLNNGQCLRVSVVGGQHTAH